MAARTERLARGVIASKINVVLKRAVEDWDAAPPNSHEEEGARFEVQLAGVEALLLIHATLEQIEVNTR